MLLNGLTLKYSTATEKAKAISEQQNIIALDFKEFETEITQNKKAFEFIKNELSKLNMDLCFIQFSENIKKFYSYFP